MVDTDPAWFGAVLAKHSRDISVASVLSVQTEAASGVGDNYASIIVRATLRVVLGSGRVTTRKVILKKALPDIPQELQSDMSGAFNLEGIVYEKLFTPYEALIIDNNLPYGKFWPDCLMASHDLIMFEDLRTRGFTLGSRKTGVDIDHAKLVFTYLARLHSLSVVAVKKGLVFPKILPTFMLVESGVADSFYRTALLSFANVIRDMWGPEWTKVEKKIRYMSENIVSILAKLYFEREPHELAVIAHGDCWVNNMMFKYDHKGSPLDLMFVDFQLCHYNSYGWDLAYFLHTSVQPKYISSYYDEFIQTYTKEFSENLQRLGHDPSVAPTAQQVKSELTRLQPFSLSVATAVLPITMNPSDVKLGLADMINDESDKFSMLVQDKQFKETIQTMFRQFDNLGMFN